MPLYIYIINLFLLYPVPFVFIIFWISLVISIVLNKYFELIPSSKFYIYSCMYMFLFLSYVCAICFVSPMYFFINSMNANIIICIIISLLNYLPTLLVRKILLHQTLQCKSVVKLDDFYYNVKKALHSSWLFRTKFIFMHFMLFHIFRILIVIVFYYCIFFPGDLRLLLCLVPLSLTVWLLSFLEYYYQYHFSSVYKNLDQILKYYYQNLFYYLWEYEYFKPLLSKYVDFYKHITYQNLTNIVSYLISTIYIYIWSSMFGSLILSYFI